MRRRIVLAVVAVFPLLFAIHSRASTETHSLVTLGDSEMSPTTGAPTYPDEIATDSGWSVTDIAQPGGAASCWGKWQVPKVTATGADRVIVALGTNDMSGSPNGCRPTLADFQTALTQILRSIRTHLPGAEVYVSAIFQRPAFESVRPDWNTAIERAAQASGAVYADPNAVLRPSDFSDGLHLNANGRYEVAEFWDFVLGNAH